MYHSRRYYRVKVWRLEYGTINDVVRCLCNYYLWTFSSLLSEKEVRKWKKKARQTWRRTSEVLQSERGHIRFPSFATSFLGLVVASSPSHCCMFWLSDSETLKTKVASSPTCRKIQTMRSSPWQCLWWEETFPAIDCLWSTLLPLKG